MTTLQKSIVAAALTVAAGTGLYAFRQGTQLRAQIQRLEQQQAPLTEQVRQLEQERNEATNQLAALREDNTRLQSSQSPRELLKLRGEVGMLRQKATASGSNASAPASGLAKMMSDPALKEYIQKAQRDKINSLYADLFKELKLTPDQTDKFLGVLCDVAAKSMERLAAPAQGGLDQPPADPLRGTKSQLQELLGDAGYARFSEYSDEIPARTTVSMLKSQLGENPLSDEQSARLLQIVKAEPYSLTQGITGAPDKVFAGSQTDIDSFLQQVTESNQRIVQQAAGFLSSDQTVALDALLSKAIDSRRLQAAALIQKH